MSNEVLFIGLVTLTVLVVEGMLVNMVLQVPVGETDELLSCVKN
jgi:hypothetical protein